MQTSPQILKRPPRWRITVVLAPNPCTLHTRTQAGRGKEQPNPFDCLLPPSLPHSPIPCQITSGSGFAWGSRCSSAHSAQDPGKKVRARSHKQLGDAILARSCDCAPAAAWRRLGRTGCSARPPRESKRPPAFIQRWLHPRRCRKCFTPVNWFTPLNNAVSTSPHFTGQSTEALRIWVKEPRSQK